jgi:hypothetical protein
MNDYTWKKALELWRVSPEVLANPSLLKNAQTALKNYVIPGIRPQLEKLTSDEFATFCQKTSVEELQDALLIFDTQFSAAVANQQISKGTRRTYRWPLSRCLEWLQQQIWYKELFPDPIDLPMPAHRGVTVKSSKGKKAKTYALKLEQLPQIAAEELIKFEEFWTKKGREAKRARRGEKHVRLSTFKDVKNYHILCFYGWYVNIEEHSLDELRLSLLTDVSLIEKHIDWLVDSRRCTHSAGTKVAQTAISVAKYLFKNPPQVDPSGRSRQRRNWSDIPVILDLRDISNECLEEYKQEKQRNNEAKWSKKELTHLEARQVVQYLRRHLTTIYGNGRGRYLSAVIWAWQRYLSVKFLVFEPVRQQEARQLELGKTLFRKLDEQGNPYYEVIFPPELHKLGSKTNKSRHYKLPNILTADLDDWFNIWRPKVEAALQSEEAWLEFWGHDPKELERIRSRIQAAQRGQVCANVKKPMDEYIADLEKKQRRLQHRLETLEIARSNFAAHNCLFFMLGSRGDCLESFGKPFNDENFCSMVTNAVEFATQALFGQPRRTNPHAFRHIGDKHVRKINNGKTRAFDQLIGHAEGMGDNYAEQILSDYEQTFEIVDNWWKE